MAFSQPPRYVNPRLQELRKLIDCEYSIRDGGAKLLQASKNSKQSMQASKGLFVSDAKIIGYMKELQHQQNSKNICDDSSTRFAGTSSPIVHTRTVLIHTYIPSPYSPLP